jgi:hypothetical protein
VAHIAWCDVCSHLRSVALNRFKTDTAFHLKLNFHVVSESRIEPDVRFEVIDRVFIDDWHADLLRERDMVAKIASDSGVKRQK